jgi:hypothetical protein
VPNDVLDGLEDAISVIRDRESRFMNFIRGDQFSLEAAKAGTGY